jgi:hypothetical protein
MLVQGSDGHRERFMITGICCGRTPVGAAWRGGVLLVGAGPVGLHTGCASPETHLRENVSRRLKRAVANCEPPTEQPTHWAITDPCHVHGTGHAVPSLGGRHAYDSQCVALPTALSHGYQRPASDAQVGP